MKIANKKELSHRGRPSLRSFTVRRSDYHITFSVKCANDLGLNKGSKVCFIYNNNNMYLCPDSEEGFTLFGYMNGQKYSTLVCTTKNDAKHILDAANASKVAVFLVAANFTTINGKKAYKVIDTPIRTI